MGPTSCCESRRLGGVSPHFWGVLACGCHEFVGLSRGAGLDPGSKSSGAREEPDRGGHPGFGLLIAAPYRLCAEGGAGQGTRGAGEAMGKLRHGEGAALGVPGRAGGAPRGCCPADPPPSRRSGGRGPLPSPPSPPSPLRAPPVGAAAQPRSQRPARSPAQLLPHFWGVSLALTPLHPSCAGPGHARPAQPAPPRLINPPGLITASLAPDAPPNPAAPRPGGHRRAGGVSPPLPPDFGVTKHPPPY